MTIKRFDFVTPPGRLLWGSLVTPTVQKGGGPDPVYFAGVEYKDEDIDDIIMRLLDFAREAAEKIDGFNLETWNNPISPAMQYPEGAERRRENLVPKPGYTTLRFKRNSLVKRNGERVHNSPPAIFDSKGMPVKGLDGIPPRSAVRIKSNAYPWVKSKLCGILLGIDGVQIVELFKPEPMFGEVTGGWSQEAETEEENTDPLADEEYGVAF